MRVGEQIFKFAELIGVHGLIIPPSKISATSFPQPGDVLTLFATGAEPPFAAADGAFAVWGVFKPLHDVPVLFYPAFEAF